VFELWASDFSDCRNDFSGYSQAFAQLVHGHLVGNSLPEEVNMKKSIVSLCLVLCLMLSTGAVQNAQADDTRTYGEWEFDRALSLGIGEYREPDEAVTYAEFMAMLDQSVALADKTKLTEWQARLPKARESGNAVLRCEAALALYLAAETLGAVYVKANYIYYDSHVAHTNPQHPSFDAGMGKSEYDLFDSDFHDASVTKYFDNMYAAEAYYTMFSSLSIFTERPILETDGISARLGEKLTYAEALLAALRLYDSKTPEVTERAPTDADREILRLAEERRQAILNSPTTVEVSGRSYYVSNRGSDKNNGRSPETAWATLDKVNKTKLRSGDGVFLKRGDIWRAQGLMCQEGITYSAYGEGPKPAIYGSPENGAGAEKWMLVEGTANIWEYYRPMRQAGAIVFNDGERFAESAQVAWDGSQYVSFTSIHPPLNVNSAFSYMDLPDLTFYSDIDYRGHDELTMASNDDWYINLAPLLHNELEGKLYLRCDAGNPGAVFDSVEFCIDLASGDWAVNASQSGVVVDNLCIKFSPHAMQVGSESAKGKKSGVIVVQNCEVGWAAGVMYGFRSDEWEGEMQVYTNYSGDGIHVGGSRTAILNNYVYECGDGGIGIEVLIHKPKDLEAWNKQDVAWENHTWAGNLIERCNVGLGFTNYENPAIPNHLFKDFLVEDNYVLYSGYGHSGDKFRRLYSAPWEMDYVSAGYAWVADYPNNNENFVIRNNVFYLASKALMANAMMERFLPVFSGNTYVQHDNGVFAQCFIPDSEGKVSYDQESRRITYNIESMAEDFVRNTLGDQTATVLPLTQ